MKEKLAHALCVRRACLSYDLSCETAASAFANSVFNFRRKAATKLFNLKKRCKNKKKSINNQTKTSNQSIKIKKNLNPDLSCSRELSSTRDSIFSSSVSSSCFSRRSSASCCSRWRFSFSALLLIEDLKGWSELTSSEDWDSVLRDLWRLQAMHSINNSQNSYIFWRTRLVCVYSTHL